MLPYSSSTGASNLWGIHLAQTLRQPSLLRCMLDAFPDDLLRALAISSNEIASVFIEHGLHTCKQLFVAFFVVFRLALTVEIALFHTLKMFPPSENSCS